MTRVRVENFTISLDRYGGGPNQYMDNTLGVGGHDLRNWMISTRTFQQMQGREGGTTGIDNDFVAQGFNNVGT